MFMWFLKKLIFNTICLFKNGVFRIHITTFIDIQGKEVFVCIIHHLLGSLQRLNLYIYTLFTKKNKNTEFFSSLLTNIIYFKCKYNNHSLLIIYLFCLVNSSYFLYVSVILYA